MNLRINRGGKNPTALRENTPPSTLQRDNSSSTLTAIHPALDYPRKNEKITSKHYTFRISVPGPAKNVEVSINQGPWQACRNSVGYWWYDWSQYSPGEHKAVIRAHAPNGEKIVSKPHEIVVDVR